MARDLYRSDSARGLIRLEFRLYRSVGALVGAMALIFLLARWLGNDETDPDTPRPAESSRQPRIDPDAIYARAELRWPAARLFKPDNQLRDQVEFSLAPLLLARSDASDPDGDQRYAFGAVKRATSGTFEVDVSKPTIYYGESTAFLRGREYRQLRYRWWHSAPSQSARASQGCRMTLDDTGRAVIWEILTDDSGMRFIFVATPLEDAARKEFGEPLPGRRHAIEAAVEDAPEVIVPRIINPGPVPMGPFLYIEGPGHSVATLICRCMESQFDDLAGDNQYELRPLSELEAQALDTARWTARLPRSAEGEGAFDDADDPGWLERCLRLPAF